jgi:hypothetical protein
MRASLRRRRVTRSTCSSPSDCLPLQSIPILVFLPVALAFFVNLFHGSLIGYECASVFVIFTSQAWNMTFSFYHSLVTQPPELDEAARMYRLTKWQRFWKLDVRADILKSKEMFGRQARERAPLVRAICRSLESTNDGSLGEGFFLDLLRRGFREEEAREQLATAISWGRYGELFDFDANAGQLRLDRGNRDHVASVSTVVTGDYTDWSTSTAASSPRSYAVGCDGW